MPILAKLRQFLDSKKVSYQVVTHPQAFTAQEVAESEHVSGRLVAKVVILRSGSTFLMVVLPAPYHVDLDSVRAAVGNSELQLASEEQFAGLFPNCEPGAMPPFGNLYGLPVWVDQSLTKDKEIIFNAGTHTETVKMKYADFARLVKPKVAALAEVQ